MSIHNRALQRFVSEQRTLATQEIGDSLSLGEAVFLVVEPSDRSRAQSGRIIRSVCPASLPVRVVSAHSPVTALSTSDTDVWLIQMCIDHFRYDALALCERLRFRFPYATIVGRSMHRRPQDLGTLCLAGAEYVLGVDEVESHLPSLVSACLLRRRHLLERLVAAALSELVSQRFGPEAAHLVGLRPPATAVSAILDVQEDSLRRALAAARGSRTDAARILGVSRQTIHRWLKRWEKGESGS